MIALLKGTIVSKSPTEVVLDVHGVGYAVSVPLSTSGRLGGPGTEALLLTHLVVREDALLLYGFADAEERETFRLLLAVTGIGPKMALGILSGLAPKELRTAILGGNAGALTTVPGVGRKLAERLIMELRDKIGRIDSAIDPGATPDPGTSAARNEAVLALVSLGHSRIAAERAVRAALLESPALESSVEALVKAALRLALR